MIKERRFDLDFIRVFSCLCVLIIHFNATLSGWFNGIFVYPNAVFPNYIFKHLYLGGLGVSMFFMLTGAALSITYPQGCAGSFRDLLVFYKKRFISIYPMFWIAWIAFCLYNLLTYKSMTDAPLRNMVLSLAGADAYMTALGIEGLGGFYLVGEWFLGCIVLLYVIYPAIDYGVRKRPIVVTLLVLITYIIFNNLITIPIISSSVSVFLRIPELLFGMFFVKYLKIKSRKERLFCIGIAFIVGTIFYIHADFVVSYLGDLTYQIVMSACVFTILACLAPSVKSLRLRTIFIDISKYTYAIFLVHHQITYILVRGFDLSNMPKRILYLLFIAYLIITGVVSVLLVKTVGLFKNSLWITKKECI